MKAKVIIEYENGSPDGKLSTIEFGGFDIAIESEIGLKEKGDMKIITAFPQEQQRFLIKGWKGCESYDSFESRITK